jgi:purine-binding chemotaxis protein CheW
MSRHVICVHGGVRFALPLSAVRQVTEVSALARVPRAPPGMLGVMNHAGRVACIVDLGALVGQRARPARPNGRIVMLHRTAGDLGLYVTDVQGIEELSDEVQPLAVPEGAAVAQLDHRDGSVKLVDPGLLSLAIDNLVEA